MIVGESIRLAVVSLRANKLRSALTLIGIIIGVTSVIAVVAIVQGLNRYVADKLLDTGSNVSYLDKFGIITNNDDWEKALKRPDVTLADAEALRELAPHVGYVVVQNARRGQVKFGRARRGNTRITGTTDGAEHVEAAEIDVGRRISREDVARRRPVIVIGSEIRDGLFGERDPIGQHVRIGGRSLEIIGVFKKQGGIGWTTQDNAVQIPYGLWTAIYGDKESPTIMFKPTSQELALAAQDEVRAVMRRRHHLRPSAEDDFGITSSELFLTFYRNFTAGLYGAMIGIAGLSLLVGGIVVMNIMLVSVTERTREIGIRKSVGAKRSDILQQFLIESAILACVGGLLGILAGAGIARLIDIASPLPTRVEWWSVALGLSVSTGVGLFFGIYPASRAARLDPIEALRYE